MRKAYTDTCDQCHAEIPDDQVAVRWGWMQRVPKHELKYRNQNTFTPRVELLCLDCAQADSGWKLFEKRGCTEQAPCEGCGRPLVVMGYGKLRHVCSDRCAQKARRSALLDDRQCAHCGETFTPKRADAKFCSTRCRVAAHRATC